MMLLNMLTFNLQNPANIWMQFFHTPESTMILAIFRIAFGILLLVNASSLWRAAEYCFYPTGALALEYQSPSTWKRTWSLFNHLPPTRSTVHFVFLMHFVGVLGLLVGFYTQLSAILVFITLVSLHHRNPYVLNSGDILQRLLSFFLIFSHAGCALSIDAWLAGTTETLADPWALRLMQVLLTLVYLRTTYWKLRGATWRAGSATYYALGLRDYQRRKLPLWLARIWFYRAASYGTLVLEGALGALLWFDSVRYPLLIAALLLHLGLQWFMRIGFFQWTMLTALLLFLKPADLNQCLQWLGVLQ